MELEPVRAESRVEEQRRYPGTARQHDHRPPVGLPRQNLEDLLVYTT